MKSLLTATLAAASLGVPPAELDAFSEVYGCQGARGARNYKSLLAKVRSNAEVRARIGALADTLQLDKLGPHAHDRLLFCGRYSAKVGTDLDESLRAAAAGLAAAHRTRQACAAAPGGKMPFTVTNGIFGDGARDEERTRVAQLPPWLLLTPIL